MVVTTSASSTTNSAGLTTADSLYADWCVINDGNSSAAAFTVSLYLDGVLVEPWNIASLPADNYIYAMGISLGSLSAGTHLVSVSADSGDAVPESNESDNSYTNTFTVTDAFLPAPSLTGPATGATNQAATPLFSWSAVPGAISYRIFIAAAILDLPASPAAAQGGLSVATNAITAAPNFTPSTPLQPGQTYYWEAQGNSASQHGHWSAVGSFTVAFPTGPGLTIVPTFDNSILSDPQAATIEATILSSIATYRSIFSDPITVRITYTEMSSGLGENSFSYGTISYASYLAALQAHATSGDDTTALAGLSGGSGNPVNGNNSVNIKYPLARALGFSFGGSGADATIFLNTSIMNLSGAGIDPAKYSLYSTVCHETDEALGLGSALDLVKSGDETLAQPVFEEDLFRYDDAGNRSYTTSASAASYFSLDGTDLLARFNQEADGDFGDWYSDDPNATPLVQDAFLSPGVFPSLGVELRALDVIGFTRAVAGKGDQTISFGPPANRSVGETFTLSASASSGLPVTFAILSGPAELTGDTVTVTNTGTVVVEASQAGNGSFNAAPDVTKSFTVYAPPVVMLTPSGGGDLDLSWATNVPGYVLQTTTNLTPPILWRPVSSGVVVGDSYVVTIPATNLSQFFRLSQ